MRHLPALRWLAVLALPVALAAGSASADESDTLTISGPFTLDMSLGTVDVDLAAALADAGNTWTLTLHGVTHQHMTFAYQSGSGTCRDYVKRSTRVNATSFEFQFAGPDAGMLNAVISDQLATDEDVSLYMENAYACGQFGWAVWWFMLPSASATGIGFYSSDEMASYSPEFATDASGFPALPSQLFADTTVIQDHRPGMDGDLYSIEDTLDVSGTLGSPVPATMSIGDRSTLEGNKGSTKMTFGVSLANASDGVITVSYRTVAGTALTKSDYTAVTGTLTFQPGETSKSITVSVKADRGVEADETFTVELFNVAGTTIADGVATGTIRNDD
jgi:hypothetical protein